ncbi:hypothetical protein [Actinopolyspora mortivallis]|uniref:hypothetical protein n=1 Tax=Actinopolyspora mortivallis TaxID=33906 RepID=UPI00037777F6|nr:hypothetical protein [Actinopolyspora mortivallis]
MGERIEPAPEQLDAEDSKIVTLARSARARIGATEGAAVRDTDGRTYTGCTVDLGVLRLSALQSAVAAAASSGAEGLEAAALVTDGTEIDPDSLAAVRALGRRVPVFRADGGGVVSDVTRDVE